METTEETYYIGWETKTGYQGRGVSCMSLDAALPHLKALSPYDAHRWLIPASEVEDADKSITANNSGL